MKTVKYTWQDNPATQDGNNDYYPKVLDIDYVTEDELINDIAVTGSILKNTELRAVILRVFQQLVEYIGEGHGFKNEYITIKPGLRGVTYDPEGPWDDERHKKYAGALLGKPFQKAAAGMALERVSAVKEAAVIESIYDRKSNTTNDALTPGHTMTVSGSQLKIHDPDDSRQGLFIVSRADNTEYPVALEENFPSKLRADIPDDLPAGSYSLKIVNTKYHNTTVLRTALSEIVLTVV